jgi:hypothetical protein
VLSRLTQLPSDLRREVHRRGALSEERASFRRAGERLAASAEASGPEALRPWQDEIRRATERLAEIAGERRAVAEAEARDLAQVSWWIRPVVLLRGWASRVVLQDHGRRVLRARDLAHEALGRAAAFRGKASPPRVVPAANEAALPLWAGRAGFEARGLAGALWNQLRSHLFPKAPALAGMAVGWWIANTYTDSRVRSVLRSVGIGSGGTHVVSGSTYRAMSFWLPLLAAAVCAYVGDRVWERMVGRKE